MDISDELKEALTRLGVDSDDIDKIDEELANVMAATEMDNQSLEIAKSAVEQLDSLTVDAWTPGQNAAEITNRNLFKLFNKDTNRDIIIYGKAVLLAAEIIKHRRAEHKALTHRIVHHKGRMAKIEASEEVFTAAAVYFAMIRIKQDILDRYELGESKPSKKEAK